MKDTWIFFAFLITFCLLIISWFQAEQAKYAKQSYDLILKMSKDTD